MDFVEPHTVTHMAKSSEDLAHKFEEGLQQNKNNEFIDAVNRAALYDIERFRTARLLEPPETLPVPS